MALGPQHHSTYEVIQDERDQDIAEEYSNLQSLINQLYERHER